MTALVLTTTTFTLERKKIFGSFFTATNELLLGLVDEKLTSFQYPLAFFASIPHYRSTPLREVSISVGELIIVCVTLYILYLKKIIQSNLNIDFLNFFVKKA